MTKVMAAMTGTVLACAGILAGIASVSAQPLEGEEKVITPACGPRVLVEYTDDDPDYFIIKNRSASGWSLEVISFDLAPSSGNVVFDSESGGPGVGGASAFEPDNTTDIRLVGVAPAEDGGRTLSLQFDNFTDGRDYIFYIDLDSAPSGNGQTWVLPGDMAGVRIVASFRSPTGLKDQADAIFDGNAEADTGLGGCV